MTSWFVMLLRGFWQVHTKGDYRWWIYFEKFGFSNMCLFIWTSIRWIFGVIITSAFQYEPDVTCLQETVYLLNILFNNMMDFPALAWVKLGPLFPNLPVFFNVWKRLQTSPFQNVQSDGMHPAVDQNTNHVGNIKGFWHTIFTKRWFWGARQSLIFGSLRKKGVQRQRTKLCQ